MSDENLETTNTSEATVDQILPLDTWHRARNGRMVSFAGYEMPIQYEGIMAEHQWTREHAGLFDVSHMGQLVLEGDDVAAALEALLPGDISALKTGRLRYSLLLDEQGGILDDLMVTNRGDHYYLVVNGATKWDDIAHLREHLPDEITLNYLDDQALLALQGPEAAVALNRLGLRPVNKDGPTVEELVFMTSGLFDWSGVELGVSRSGYTGEDGFEISVASEHAEALASALAEQPEVKPIGLGARDSLRLEAGLPLYGHDLGPDTNPVEADLVFAVSKRRREEGGFLGATPVLRSLQKGPERRRVGLSVDGKLPVREGAEIFSGDTNIGRATSGGFAPTVGAPIAMAYVSAEFSTAGTVLEAEVRGRRIPVTVTPMPFVPHRYVRKGATK